MRIEPAHIDQIRRARDGRMALVSADVGGVADELKRIHPGLKVRFAEHGNPPYWAVFFESEDGRETYLILTAKAWQNHAGVWEGFDQRIVDRVRQIDRDGRSGYDYAKELESSTLAVRERAHERFRKLVEETGELAAHAIRKDLGVRYRGRAFIPREVV